MFEELQKINQRPRPFEYYTTNSLWTDSYISKKMLEAHLDKNNDAASRNQEFIRKSVEWISSHFSIKKGSKVCDFGCGPGLYTTLFAEKQAVVTGIDFSKRSIDYAKKIAKEKNLKIKYHCADYFNFSTDERFDLITMIYCDFCVLSPQQKKIIFQNFNKLLKDDGSILLDVHTTNYFKEKKEKRSYEYSSDKTFWSNFWSNQPYYAFLNVFKYQKEKLLLDKYTIIEKDRVREFFNWIQCYSLESLKKEFFEHGFQIVEYYSNVAGLSYQEKSTEMAIVTKKISHRS